MPRYIAFPSAGDGSLYVELSEQPQDPSASDVDSSERIVKAGLESKMQAVVQNATVAFDQAIAAVGHGAQAFMRAVSQFDQRPEQVEITFGLKASGEVNGFVIAKAGAEANFNVKLTWKPKS